MFKVLAVIGDISLSIHDEFKMYKPLSRKPVPLNISCPRRALDVHQDLKWILLVFASCLPISPPHPWHRILQLNHHDGTQVASLVSVRVKVSRESSKRSVRHRSNVLNIGIVLPVTVKPDHVHVRTRTLVRSEASLHTLLLVDSLDVVLKGKRHPCVVSDLVDGVRLGHPSIDPVQLDQNARLAKAVPLQKVVKRYCSTISYP